jgi:hypothetical protein
MTHRSFLGSGLAMISTVFVLTGCTRTSSLNKIFLEGDGEEDYAEQVSEEVQYKYIEYSNNDDIEIPVSLNGKKVMDLPGQALAVDPTDPLSFSYVITVEDIVGSWSTLEDSNYEEIIFSPDGIYSTFLHEKPFDTGTWKVVKGFLIMNGPEFVNKMFTDVVVEEGMLIAEGEGIREVWEKI